MNVYLGVAKLLFISYLCPPISFSPTVQTNKTNINNANNHYCWESMIFDFTTFTLNNFINFILIPVFDYLFTNISWCGIPCFLRSCTVLYFHTTFYQMNLWIATPVVNTFCMIKTMTWVFLTRCFCTCTIRRTNFNQIRYH